MTNEIRTVGTRIGLVNKVTHNLMHEPLNLRPPAVSPPHSVLRCKEIYRDTSGGYIIFIYIYTYTNNELDLITNQTT